MSDWFYRTVAKPTLFALPGNAGRDIAAKARISAPTRMTHKPKKPSKPAAPASIIRSSAAEYLTFVAASGASGVEALYADENVWLTQKMMGLLYAVETHMINYHLKKIFTDSELTEDAVIRNFRITAADGKTYDTRPDKSVPAAAL